MTGYIAHTMTEGELMYYGHDSEYSKEGGAVYFLYLKDLNNSAADVAYAFMSMSHDRKRVASPFGREIHRLLHLGNKYVQQ